MTLANPTPEMDDRGPLTADESNAWSWKVDPPQDEQELDVFERCGVYGLIGWRCDRDLSAARRAARLARGVA